MTLPVPSERGSQHVMLLAIDALAIGNSIMTEVELPGLIGKRW